MSAPIKLVCVANPSAYRGTASGVPTFHQRLAADARIELHHVSADELRDADPLATRRVPPDFEAADFGRLDALALTPLAAGDVDLVLCRTLKPLPPGYMAILRGLAARVRFVNAPDGISRHLELDFAWSVIAPYAPPGVVVHGLSEEAERFAAAHPRFVVKRGNSCGGKGVYRVRRVSEGLLVEGLARAPERVGGVEGLLAHLRQRPDEPLLFMRYLPRVMEGDLRVFVVAGEIVGAMLRRNPGSWIQNLSAGAVASAHGVPEQVRRVVAATASIYAALGVTMLGYDFLRGDAGDWMLSEINAGNVGGFVALERASGVGVVARVIDAIVSLARGAGER